MPQLIAHADWSARPRGRWIAFARRTAEGFEADAPRPAPDPFILEADLTGFDFPIGLPREYAAQAGIQRFVDALPEFGEDFYRRCDRREEISISRPFYPARPGGTKRSHLTDALGPNRLRECDRRARAGELFWTLGPKQVGCAALCGWREILTPALRTDQVRIWPFHGSLQDLLQSGKRVVVECYPAEAAARIGLKRNFGKRYRTQRAAQARVLLDWAERAGVSLTLELRAAIKTGFTNDDAFDAVLGTFGILDVLLGVKPLDEPEDPFVREVEGWILGLDGTDRCASKSARSTGHSAG